MTDKVPPEMWNKYKPIARDFRHSPTKAERALWRLLRDRSLGGMKFRRQHTIGRYIVDFYCPGANLVIEVDGPIHDSQREADTERQQALEAMGLNVLRFRNDEVLTDSPTVQQTILKVIHGPS